MSQLVTGVLRDILLHPGRAIPPPLEGVQAVDSKDAAEDLGHSGIVHEQPHLGPGAKGPCRNPKSPEP